LLGACSTWATAGALYERVEAFMGQDFFEPFRWGFHTGDDPTHGTVDYVNYSTASIAGLVNATAERVYMGADTTTVITRSAAARRRGPRGRRSVRITSRKTYNSGLFVVRLDHMPTGCGVWPAFWMYGEDPQHIWPRWGEFDIIEGVHRANRTMTTLHTTAACNQRRVRSGNQFTGKWERGLDRNADNCDVHAKGQWGNQGCSQEGPDGSVGAPFNRAGGGTFAAEWDPEGGHFRTWFWSALEGLPADLQSHAPNPDSWGRPYSFFELSDEHCSKDHFKNMRLVFDITFCGDLGVPTFAQGCPEVARRMTCEEWVDKHPEEFKEAYWSIRGLDVYRKATAPATQASTTAAPAWRSGSSEAPLPAAATPEETQPARPSSQQAAEQRLEALRAAGVWGRAAGAARQPTGPPAPGEASAMSPQEALLRLRSALHAAPGETTTLSPQEALARLRSALHALPRSHARVAADPWAPVEAPAVFQSEAHARAVATGKEQASDYDQSSLPAGLTAPRHDVPTKAPEYAPAYTTRIIMKAMQGSVSMWKAFPYLWTCLTATIVVVLVASLTMAVRLRRRLVQRDVSCVRRDNAGSGGLGERMRYKEISNEHRAAPLIQHDPDP